MSWTPVSVAEVLDVPGRPNEMCPGIPSPSLQSCVIEGSSSESGQKIQMMQAISGGKQFAFVFGGRKSCQSVHCKRLIEEDGEQ